MKLNKSELTNIFTKYSDFSIRQYFKKSLLNKKQISVDFHNNNIKIQQLEDELVNKAIAFRDACIDPDSTYNEKVIRNHFMYLNDPLTRSNAQARGPQCDLSNRIFRDCAIAGNEIHKTSMSALSFNSEINLNYNEVFSSPIVSVPNSFFKANLDSFKQGMECVHANVISAVNAQEVNVTGDELVKIPSNFKPKNNLPFNQNIADCYRKAGNNAVFEDIKDRAINLITSDRTPKPCSVFPGTLSKKEEAKAISTLAFKAKNDVYNNNKTKVRHLLPQKDNIKEKVEILEKVEQNSSVKDQKELIGLASVYSNKFHNPVNYKPLNSNSEDL